MRCAAAGKQLQLYSDGRLPLEHVRPLELHLASCASCREELRLLEMVAGDLDASALVIEPGDMHEQIMQRVMQAAETRAAQRPFSPWRPSLVELLAAILLATIATLGSIIQQPTLRALLPIANGHDSLSLAFLHLIHMLTSMDSSTLAVVLWIAGTFLGICITLVCAGTEMRAQWFKAMMDRLPVR
jgi:hypothetical protein